MSGKLRPASGCRISLRIGGELMSKGSRQFVPDVPNLDHEARAELLTYLVASQLVSRSRTEGWLTPVHLAESEQVWQLPPFRNAGFLANFFTDGWRLDYRSSLVRCLNKVCVEELLRAGSDELSP
jgi:hypothetical protein